MISVVRFLRQSAALGSADLNALAITNATLDYSESFSPNGMDVAGIAISVNTLTGTTPTITVALEVSPDGGSTWFSVPKRDASATAVTTAALVTGGKQLLFAEIPVSESGAASNPLYRWAFVYNDADNDSSALSAWLIMRKFNQRLG